MISFFVSSKLDGLLKGSKVVTPANPPEVYPPPEGGQEPGSRTTFFSWIPAFAGMTEKGRFRTFGKESNFVLS